MQQWLHERSSIACLVWNNIVIICAAVKNGLSPFIFIFVYGTLHGPPLWSSGQSFLGSIPGATRFSE